MADDDPRELELFEQAKAGDLSAMKANLAANSVNVNCVNGVNWTPLIWAACNGNDDVVAFLLDRGANADAQNDQGTSALHMAAYNGHPDVLNTLLKAGADVTVEDNDGKTPLDYAKDEGDEAAIAALTEAAKGFLTQRE